MNDRLYRIVPGLSAKLQMGVDLLLVAFCIPFILNVSGAISQSNAIGLVALGLLAWLIAAAVVRLYSPCTPRSELDTLTMGAVASLSVVVVVAPAYTVVSPAFSLVELVELVLMIFAAISLNSILLRGRKVATWIPQDRVLIIGTGALGQETFRRLSNQNSGDQDVVGFLRFPDEPKTFRDISSPVLGEVGQLREILADWAVNEVYIAGRVLTHGAQMQEVVRLCENVGMPFAVPLHSLQYERALLLAPALEKAGDGYLHYLNSRPSPVQRAIKRLVDIVASAAALAVLSPLLVVVAILIKATSKGPIFFHQARSGLHGATFNLLKFRSMVVNAEEIKAKLQAQNEQAGPVFKMKRDPRITKVGRFIRKYSIDELPQLVNILRGEMSIVGPRPPLPAEVAQYKTWQRRRLSVRPGLTCYWQVGGRNNIGFEEWMRLDLRYVDNWSLAVDARLIMQTVPVVLRGTGAS